MKEERASLRSWMIFAAVTFLVAATLMGVAATGDEPTGQEILEEVNDKYEDAENVVGSAEVTVENETEEWTADVEFAVAQDNRSRLTIREKNRTVVVGTNGSAGWMYEPTTGITRTYDNDSKEEKLEQKVLEARERYENEVESKYIGTETVEGKETYVVEAYSTNETVSETARLWVDTDDSTVLKAEVTSENGTATATATFGQTEFNVSVHESTYEPPSEGGDLVPGAERETFETVEEASSETELTVPDIPEEYETEEVLVASYRGQETVTSTYETEAGEVYVAVTTEDSFGSVTSENTERKEESEIESETIDLGEETGTYINSEMGSMVYWTENGRTVAVFTRGSRSTAIEVAEAVS